MDKLIGLSALTLVGSLSSSVVNATCLSDQPHWYCVTGAGQVCDLDTINHHNTMQILVLSAGYPLESDFVSDMTAFVEDNTDIDTSWEDKIWSYTEQDNIIYISYWTGGKPIEGFDDTSNYESRFTPSPTRDSSHSLAQNNNLIDQQVTNLKAECDLLQPSAVTTLYNLTSLEQYRRYITDNASLRSQARTEYVSDEPYGLARISNVKIGGKFVGPHELGHAAMNWGDEYIEDGLYNLNIRTLDVLSFAFVLDQGIAASLQTLLGIYPVRVSESLIANGVDNVSTVMYPGRVGLPENAPATALQSEEYLEEGAVVGYGLYHMMDFGNLMSTYGARNQSISQQRITDYVFNVGPARINDRIVNAGPPNGYQSFGRQAKIMLYDEDKNHAHHPTERYDVQIQWDARKLSWCPSETYSFLKVPCFTTEAVTLQKSFTPDKLTARLNENVLFNLATSAVNMLCDVTNDGLSIYSVEFCLAEDPSQFWVDFVGSLNVHLPYQFVHIPTPDQFTDYYWRFRTFNGEYESGWTQWSRIDRAL